MLRSPPALPDPARDATPRARLGAGVPAADAAPARPVWAPMAGHALGALMRLAAHAITGVRGLGHVAPASGVPRVYFANHASHGDIVLLWATLPRHVRARTRPVAGGDYWNASPLRRFIGRHVFDVLPIDRGAGSFASVPLNRMIEALDRGQSLILFPEGTRNTSAAALLPLKCGLFYLGQSRAAVEIVPAWIDNAGRAMAKGRWFPVPILCTVSYGAALRVEPGEDKCAFMQRATAALEALRPGCGAVA